jgi:hypothetical protein
VSEETDRMEPLELGEVVYVAFGSRIGERGVVIRRHGSKHVWLEPIGAEEPLGYYMDWELSRDGTPSPSGEWCSKCGAV